MTTLLPPAEPWDTPAAEVLPDWYHPTPPEAAHGLAGLVSQPDPALRLPAEDATTDEFIASSKSARLRLLALCARLRHAGEEPLWPATG